ncbi:hypothetical protein [Stakelama tenebrarum]|uniref:Uncharacterized protein n=1 Tax=Stakelama tenebrarum TaxID=2711215 RepID=A0A6G6Y4Y7_9SPHN|nr:hypothetical protein [Sphingosinithalassobacter tenebrarum]QIG79911.1 hypothetical protein G5C33_09060 [Sphingosinithalassobacter tenebrarum]
MSDRVDFSKGGLVAAAAGGPIGAAILATGALVEGGVESAGTLISFIPLVGISFIFGFFISAIPAMFGSYAMASLGCAHIWARAYAAWGIAGGFIGGGVITLLTVLIGSVGLFLATRVMGASVFLFGAATGTLCALLARRYVRWLPEESE